MDKQQQYCTFLIDGQYYGVAVDNVQEVLAGQHITNVPLSPDPVMGLLNIRGRIVTAMDMRRVLGLPDIENRDEAMNVVVWHEGDEVSLIVDAIDDIVSLSPQAMERVPETIREELKSYIAGVFSLDAGLLMILDVGRILEDERCLRISDSASRAAAGTDKTLH